MSLKGTVVWDLDSTIADTSARHYLSPAINPDETWDSYAAACALDKPMRGTIALLTFLYVSGMQTVILTGRVCSAREQTVQWLAQNEVPWHILRMREPEDSYSNIEYKINFMKSLPELPVLFVSDWSPECQAARKILGIPSVCINPEYTTVTGSNDPTMGLTDYVTPYLLDNR